MIALKVPFQVQAGAVVTTDNYDEIVKAQVFDALTTNQGERLMRPTWGCNIRALLFDPSESLARSDTANHIKTSLGQFVPRATIESVTIEPDQQTPNLVFIKVAFKTSPYVEVTVTTVAFDLSKPQV